MKEETYICAICGRKYPISQREEFDGQFLCPRCFAEETVACHVCGERVWTDDNAGNSDTPLCERCYDRYYANCVRCGSCFTTTKPTMTGTTLTRKSRSAMPAIPGLLGERAIQDYCYKPEPIFLWRRPQVLWRGTGN